MSDHEDCAWQVKREAHSCGEVEALKQQVADAQSTVATIEARLPQQIRRAEAAEAAVATLTEVLERIGALRVVGTIGAGDGSGDHYHVVYDCPDGWDSWPDRSARAALSTIQTKEASK